MSNARRRVSRGETMAYPATVYNDTLALLEQDAMERFGRGYESEVPDLMRRQRTAYVPIENLSGENCDVGYVLGIDSPIFEPTSSGTGYGAYNERVSVVGKRPRVDHIGKYTILVTPIANGKIGIGCIAGPVQTKINLTNTAHTHGEAQPMATRHLRSGFSGSSLILWADTDAAPGIVDCLVLMLGRSYGAASSVLFPVRVWRDGGTTDGSATLKCNRTYKVRSLEATGPDTGGILYGSSMSPVKPRPALGQLSTPPTTGAGVVGLAYEDHNGFVILYDAGEIYATAVCPT